MSFLIGFFLNIDQTVGAPTVTDVQKSYKSVFFVCLFFVVVVLNPKSPESSTFTPQETNQDRYYENRHEE